MTDPDVPGTEKLVICSVDDKWLTRKRIMIPAGSIGENTGSLLGPQNVFTVKGFNRSTCALLVMLATFELRPLMEAG